jgi:hypothetical protein
MIRFGLRLALASGRDAATRLAIIAVAVAIGVGLLLATLAGINAVNAQNARYAWLNTGTGQSTASDRAPAWWALRGDYYDGQTIGRVDVAATGPDSPVPPGIPRLPGPGEFYASPALATLLADTPAAELGDRFPGHQVGTIGASALPAPNSLLIVIGRTPEQVAALPGAHRVTSIRTTVPSRCNDCVVGINTAGLDLILSVVALALLFPVLMFIGTATRLAATRREQRFAAMRLVGATPRQISVISAVESTVAAATGTAVGFGLFFLFRHELAAIPFTGAPFFPGDLSLHALDALLVALGVPVGAAIAARIALRRVHISPLGVSRRVRTRPPRPYRLIPLLLGLGELAYFIGRRPMTTNGQLVAFLSGFFLVMGGLVIAGPWLTMVGARALAVRSSRPATLIAARRLADDPKAGFRAISGLVLALFVTSVAVGVITTIAANRGVRQDDSTASTVMSVEFWPDGSDRARATSVPPPVSTDLRSTPGVANVTVVRANPDDHGPGSVPGPGPVPLPGLVSCADLAQARTLGRCADGAVVAAVYPNFTGPDRQRGNVWPAASRTVDELQKLPVLAVVVGTDRSTSTLERVRTVLEVAYPDHRVPPATEDDFNTDSTKTMAQWQQLANVVILTSLPIAGSSLAVSVAGGLAERKRPFSLLRLTGAPLRVLRQVVALESAVPLLIAATVAIGTGFVAAQLFLRAQMDYSLRPPGVAYYVIVLAGLAVSLGIIASTLPLLERITGPETARNE